MTTRRDLLTAWLGTAVAGAVAVRAQAAMVSPERSNALGNIASTGISITSLDAAIDAHPAAAALVMNKAIRNRISGVARLDPVVTVIWGKHPVYGRLAIYNDLPLLVAGHDGDSQPILDFNENGGRSTSVYVVDATLRDVLTAQEAGIADIRSEDFTEHALFLAAKRAAMNGQATIVRRLKLSRRAVRLFDVPAGPAVA